MSSYSSLSPNPENSTAKAQLEIHSQRLCSFSCPEFLHAEALHTVLWSVHLYVHLYPHFMLACVKQSTADPEKPETMERVTWRSPAQGQEIKRPCAMATWKAL